MKGGKCGRWTSAPNRHVWNNHRTRHNSDCFEDRPRPQALPWRAAGVCPAVKVCHDSLRVHAATGTSLYNSGHPLVNQNRSPPGGPSGGNKTMKMDHEQQMAQAEEVLGESINEVGFAKGLFFGEYFDHKLLPYPDLKRDPRVEDMVARLREFCRDEIDAAAIDRDAEIPKCVI